MHEVSGQNVQPCAGLSSSEMLFNLALKIKCIPVHLSFLACLETVNDIF